MLARHAPVEATPAKSRPAPPSTFGPRPPIQAPFEGVVLQCKGACPCGGGCPTCQSARSSLTISEPDDAYEQEADRVAGEVMRMPDGASGAHSGRFTEDDTLSRRAALPALIRRPRRRCGSGRRRSRGRSATP